jgi:MSHA pilin protein MshA
VLKPNNSYLNVTMDILLKISRVNGFTLIELVIVIVILGILAVIAMPKFIDLSGTANTASIRSIAGALSSASSSNYIARKANASIGGVVGACSDVGSLLQGGLPSGYSISPAATSVSINSSVTCTIINSAAATSATFTAIGS